VSRITIASIHEKLLFVNQYTPSMHLEPASPKAAQSPNLARISWYVPRPGGTSLSFTPNSSEYSVI
jgi:hypothetical protein